MFSLLYVSSSVHLMSNTELTQILEEARDTNARAGITGMLLYKDGNFMQALEGEEQEVRGLFARISGDPRHHGIITLLEETIPERHFPTWSMGFRDLTSVDLHALPGYSEFLNTQLTGKQFAHEPARAKRLLLTFKQRM